MEIAHWFLLLCAVQAALPFQLPEDLPGFGSEEYLTPAYCSMRAFVDQGYLVGLWRLPDQASSRAPSVTR
jgi:hypothetical protein